MKMSRKERRIYNIGKKEGYAEGYAQGLYDGNPFNRMIDAVKSMVDKMTTPEVLKAIEQMKEVNEVNKCCGNCKYIKEFIDDEAEVNYFGCNNDDADNFAESVAYNDQCSMWEGK